MPYIPNPETERLERNRQTAVVDAEIGTRREVFEEHGVAGLAGYINETALHDNFPPIVEEPSLVMRGVHKVAEVIRRKR